MKEVDVLRMFLARRDNYGVSSVKHVQGRVYSVVMGGEHYQAVVLTSSFDFYEKRYHIAKDVPNLVICYVHDTVIPVKALSVQVGNLAQPYELPESITDIEQQRKGKIGSQVLLGMYKSGMRRAQIIVKELPPTTRKRYLDKAKALDKRKRGKPVARGDGTSIAS